MTGKDIVFKLGNAIQAARALEKTLEDIRKEIALMSEQVAEAQAQEDVPVVEIPADTAKMLAIGERAWGRMKHGTSLSGLDIPAGALVTRYPNPKGDGEKMRVWAGARFRHKTVKWFTDRVKRVQSPARQLKREQNSSAKQAQRKVAPRTKAQAQATPAASGEKLSKSARQVQAHNVSKCTCKQNWLCPAAQAYGRVAQEVDGVIYQPGAHVTGFDPAGATDTLRGRLSEAWS